MGRKDLRDRAPNNAILVIAGDVDASDTLAAVKRVYDPIRRRPVGSHPDVSLQPVKAESFTLDSNLPYTLVFLAFRMAGTSSPDFAATRILSDVISSQRTDLYGLASRRTFLNGPVLFSSSFRLHT